MSGKFSYPEINIRKIIWHHFHASAWPDFLIQYIFTKGEKTFRSSLPGIHVSVQTVRKIGVALRGREPSARCSKIHFSPVDLINKC